MPMLPMFGYIISGIIGAPFIVLGIYVMIAVRLNEGAMGFGVWMLCGGVLLVIGIPQVVIFFIEMEFIMMSLSALLFLVLATVATSIAHYVCNVTIQQMNKMRRRL
jgi:hypothetical protein